MKTSTRPPCVYMQNCTGRLCQATLQFTTESWASRRCKWKKSYSSNRLDLYLNSVPNWYVYETLTSLKSGFLSTACASTDCRFAFSHWTSDCMSVTTKTPTFCSPSSLSIQNTIQLLINCHRNINNIVCNNIHHGIHKKSRVSFMYMHNYWPDSIFISHPLFCWTSDCMSGTAKKLSIYIASGPISQWFSYNNEAFPHY